jgi:hypothetical protein
MSSALYLSRVRSSEVLGVVALVTAKRYLLTEGT